MTNYVDGNTVAAAMQIQKAIEIIRSSPKCSYDWKVFVIIDKLSPLIVPEDVIARILDAPKGTIGASLTTLCDSGYVGKDGCGYRRVT